MVVSFRCRKLFYHYFQLIQALGERIVPLPESLNLAILAEETPG